jgi:UDP-2-acetamido-2-deoxy-ribo-hexuluronate aminotransferase
MKNLVFDVNVILDLWLTRCPESHLRLITSLLRACRQGSAHGWVASSSLHILEYLAIRQFKREGVDPAEAKRMVRQLLANLLRDLKPLTLFGFHLDQALLARTDLEDAQIVTAATQLQGPTAIVTNDKRFDITGTALTQLKPTEAPAWLQAPPTPGALDFIDLKTQQDALRPQLERNLHRVLHHGQFILGPEVRELEARLAAYTGAKHCITVASGTEALLISLMALGIGPGDEVITTPFTFVATAEVIVLVGATPVFVDIEPDTGNIDARLIEAKLSPRTKAILPVSLYGQPADMDAINAIAARHGLPVIEDAAQSFGATYKGRQSGNLSTLGCTSFFPSKPLGCYGDGGAIFTSDDALAQACREIRVHGQSQRYVHTRIGVGGRMDTLQCAIVLAKLDRFDHEIAQRQAVARRYHALLAPQEEPRAKPPSRQADPPTQNTLCALAPLRETFQLLPWPQPDRTSVFAQYTLRVPDRAALQARLQAAGIPTAVHYPVPLNEQPAYAHLCCPDCTPVARQMAREVMSLPMHPDLTEADQDRIVSAIAAAAA